jgi:hypothetical protein
VNEIRHVILAPIIIGFSGALAELSQLGISEPVKCFGIKRGQ